MRSFPLTMRSAAIGEGASANCDYCEAEVNYHLDDSALPNADEVKKIKQGVRQFRPKN